MPFSEQTLRLATVVLLKTLIMALLHLSVSVAQFTFVISSPLDLDKMKLKTLSSTL